MTSIVLILCLLLTGDFAYLPTQEQFQIHNQLQDALFNDTFTLFTLSELFFPRVGVTPVCVPIKYELSCNNTSQHHKYNASFLWTTYNSQSHVGQILLGYAYYGVILTGFDWEKSCWFFSDAVTTVLPLNVSDLECNNYTNFTLQAELQAFTAVLKSYANTQGLNSKPLSGDSINAYRGYAIEWNEVDHDNKIFETTYIILTTLIAVLDFFIFFFSLGICSSVYDAIYGKIKHKKNPYYPIFCSFILCSIVWNVFPAWYILTPQVAHVKYSFAALVPVQLVLAIIMRKYIDFPIPGIKWKRNEELSPLTENDNDTSEKHKHNEIQKYFFWEICHLKNRVKVILSFVAQTIAVWSLLVLFSYVVFYAITLAISLYLFPLQTLVKVIFIKAVALCVVFDVAILFSGRSFRFACDKTSNVGNIRDIAQLLAVLSFLPVLAFLAYVIGGVIFTASLSQLSGLQGILAILPSAVLVLIGWYSKGKLFPEKLIANDSSVSQVEKDVEAVKDKVSKSPLNTHVTRNQGTRRYGSLDTHSGASEIIPLSSNGSGDREVLLDPKSKAV